MRFLQKLYIMYEIFGKYAKALGEDGAIIWFNYRNILIFIDTPFIDAIIHLCLKQ